jgi:hypothetical protein
MMAFIALGQPELNARLSVSAIFDSALFKVFDGLTQRFAAAAGLVPSSVPRLA